LPKRTGKITGGEILFKGSNLLDLSEEEMRSCRGDKISMIFQDPMTSLNPVIAVGEQIAEALELHNTEGMSAARIAERVDEMFYMVGIPADRKYEYPHQFSGGMKQRVVIAIALACNPELLIADEPTTALDVTIQAQVLALMKDLKDRLNTSMIMITHDLGVVAETCDKVAVIYAGNIIESGTVEDLFEGKFHHPYTAGLFGSIPSPNDDRTRLKPVNGLMPDPANLPSGCTFHPRCPRATPVCAVQKPRYVQRETQAIRCSLFDQAGKEEDHDR
jgi:peptide/nickel transport system ATP-binding protein